MSDRILSIMKELVECTNCLNYIPVQYEPEAIEKLEKGQCHEAAAVLNEHWRLEQLYVDERDARTKEEIKKSTQTLCKLLLQDPVSMEILHQLTPLDPDTHSDKLDELVQLFSAWVSLTQYHLENSQEEKKFKKELAEISESRFKQSEDERRMLSESLADMRSSKESEIEALQRMAEKLQRNITQSNQAAINELRSIEVEWKEEQTKLFESHKKELNELQEKTSFYETNSEQMKLEHREMEDTLRKKKVKAGNEVAALIQKHEEDMLTMQQDIEDLQSQVKEAKQKCLVYQEHFRKVDDEKARIDAENEVLASARAREDQQIQIFNEGAIRIQKVFRGHFCRSIFLSKFNKNKGAKKASAKGKAKKSAPKIDSSSAAPKGKAQIKPKK